MGRPKLGAKKLSDRVEVRLDRDVFDLTEADRLSGRFSAKVRWAIKNLYTTGELDRVLEQIAKKKADHQREAVEIAILERKARALKKAAADVDARQEAEQKLRGQIRKHLAGVRAQAMKTKSRQLTVQWQKWLEARVRQLKAVPLVEAARILREEVPGLDDDLVQRVEHRR